jgi:uncharacterized protein
MQYSSAMRTITVLLLFLLARSSQAAPPLITWATVSAATKQCTPAREGWVNDTANVLSSTERNELSEMLSAYHDETHHQLVILTVPTLSGETIETFSQRVFNCWGIGYKGVNNGILIVLAINDRQGRIELGLGMSPYITDATAWSVMNSLMTPEFKQRHYALGLKRGLEKLMQEARHFVVQPSDLPAAHGAP